MKILNLLEVVIINQNDKHQEPLKDSDTIKVYHGTDSLELCYIIATKGFTGDQYISRLYSYESNNNPRGMFVSPSFKTAKYFGPYVIEFHCKVSDLEAPVWPSGTFTVQGGKTGIFRDDDEREAERDRVRQVHSSGDDSAITNSDRPELAHSLMRSGESQALFTGSVDRNGITAIWVSDNPQRVTGQYSRMSTMDFIKSIKSGGIPTKFGDKTEDDLDDDGDVMKDARYKVINPRDDVDWDTFIKMFRKSYETHLDDDELAELFATHPSYIEDRVWNTRQYNKIVATMPKEDK